MIRNVIVVGAGSAGLLVALSLKRKLPQLDVRVVRSKNIGVIGVGESTTPNFPKHLFDYLGISRKRFYEIVRPTWKLGIKFLWGPRKRFDYSFNVQLDCHYDDLSRPTGFYCDEDFSDASLLGAMMRRDRVFPRQPNGAPYIHPWHAFHIENKNFLTVMEALAKEHGIAFVDGEVGGVDRGPAGVEAIRLDDGRRLEADFFVDCSGFRSELLGRALGEPFESFASSLFCDRAVVGGWERGPGETLDPYTTAETMDGGWAWKIDHEKLVNRGYVYSSNFTSDDAAAEEFCRKNPKAKDPRVVKFRSGRYRRLWVDNVVALGNAAGFVEPLEATAIMVLCGHTEMLIEMLTHNGLEPTDSARQLFNDLTGRGWQDIRSFLSLHYKFNTLLDTPFWRAACNDVDVAGAAGLLEFYRANGPSNFCRHRMPQSASDFGLEGYLVMLVGNKVPYDKRHAAPPAEQATWQFKRQAFAGEAAKGMRPEEALQYVHHPGWEWNADKA